MKYITLIYFILFCNALAAKNWSTEKLITEQISEHVGFQIVKSNSESLFITLELDSKNSQLLASNIKLLSYQLGFEFTNNESVFSSKFSIVFNQIQKDSILSEIYNYIDEHNNDINYFSITLFGNVAEQKVTGDLYKYLKKIKSNNELVRNKNKTIYSLQEQDQTVDNFIAALMVCVREDIKTTAYVFYSNSFYCSEPTSTSPLNQGQVANLLVRYKSYFTAVNNSKQDYTLLLNSLKLDDGAIFTGMLPASLTSISIEPLHQRYLEILSSNRSNKISKDNLIDSSGNLKILKGLRVVDDDNQSLTLAINLKQLVDACSILDCDLLGKTINFSFSQSIPSLLVISDIDLNYEENIKAINNMILKPLLYSGIDVSLFDYLIFHDGQQPTMLQNLENSLSLLASNQDRAEQHAFTSNLFCLEQLNLNDRLWGVEKLLVYDFISSQSNNQVSGFKSFNVLNSNCTDIAMQDVTLDSFKKSTKNISVERLDTIKLAFINRLNLSQDNPHFYIFNEIYKYDVINFHSSMVSNVTLEQVNQYLDEIIYN
ncbi:hypothetical protein [Kangiella sp. HZ709]|uniref:hypothetical protein n=1 Tax=Kangiella sp. HZ709 TaxID=2666328 RepID=UPI0012B09DC3|nr:hypothetical protein [Kangiella sp. HZ709]MRX28475.1 hypothetical protein [Kangiella sp. HZ709]